MIVGRGLIAREFFKYKKKIKKNTILFASGVSNSNNKNKKRFSREIKKLKQYLNYKKKIIYFSSIDTLNHKRKTEYLDHKRYCENLIMNSNSPYLIIRTTQIVGKSKNKNTLFNFLIEKIKRNKTVYIYNNYIRNLIQISDFSKFVIKKIKCDGFLNLMGPENISAYRLALKIKKNCNTNTKIKKLKKNDFFYQKILSQKKIKIYTIKKKNYNDQLIKKFISKK
jgi:hypothetical protein